MSLPPPRRSAPRLVEPAAHRDRQRFTVTHLALFAAPVVLWLLYVFLRPAPEIVSAPPATVAPVTEAPAASETPAPPRVNPHRKNASPPPSPHSNLLRPLPSPLPIPPCTAAKPGKTRLSASRARKQPGGASLTLAASFRPTATPSGISTPAIRASLVLVMTAGRVSLPPKAPNPSPLTPRSHSKS